MALGGVFRRRDDHYRRSRRIPPGPLTAAGTVTMTTWGAYSLANSAYRVLPRAADGNGDLAVSGTYSGAPTAIEYRIVDHGTSTAIAGHDWQTLDAAPAGGSWSGTVANIQAGGWYNVHVRFSNDVSVTDLDTTRVGVGLLIGLIGQSNGRRLAEEAGTYTVTSEVGHFIGTSSIGETLDQWTLKEDVGSAKLGDVISAAISLPVGIVKFANSSSSLNQNADTGSGYWLNTAASSIYDDFQVGVSNNGDLLDAVVWDQGETEAIAGSGQARYDATSTQYYNDLGTLRTNIAADITPANGASSIPLFILQTGRDTRDATAEGASLEYTEVRRGQQLMAEKNADVYISTKVDKTPSDGVHYSGANYIVFGERLAQAILHHLGQSADWPHPVCASWAIVNATTLDVTITHGDGSDFTPTSAITGFEVRVDGLWEVPSAAVRQSATVIRLTHTSGTAQRVRYCVGREPTFTAPVVDNTATSLPLMPNDDIPTSGGGADAVLVPQGLHPISAGIAA